MGYALNIEQKMRISGNDVTITHRGDEKYRLHSVQLGPALGHPIFAYFNCSDDHPGLLKVESIALDFLKQPSEALDLSAEHHNLNIMGDPSSDDDDSFPCFYRDGVNYKGDISELENAISDILQAMFELGYNPPK